jgi:hypothetical protein
MQKHFNFVHFDSVHSDSARSDSAHSDSAHSDSVHFDSVHSDSAHFDSKNSKNSNSNSIDSKNSSSNSIDLNLIANFNDINRVISTDEKIYSIKSRLFILHWLTILSSSTYQTHFLKLNLIIHILFFIKHDWQKVLTSLLWRRILVAMIECFLFKNDDELFILKTKMLE